MTRFASSFVALAAGLLCTCSAFAQGGMDFSRVEIKTTQLAPDFWTLEGQGGTISVLAGADGVLLVDSQFAPLTDRLVAAVRPGQHADRAALAFQRVEVVGELRRLDLDLAEIGRGLRERGTRCDRRQRGGEKRDAEGHGTWILVGGAR